MYIPYFTYLIVYSDKSSNNSSRKNLYNKRNFIFGGKNGKVKAKPLLWPVYSRFLILSPALMAQLRSTAHSFSQPLLCFSFCCQQFLSVTWRLRESLFSPATLALYSFSPILGSFSSCEESLGLVIIVGRLENPLYSKTLCRSEVSKLG